MRTEQMEQEHSHAQYNSVKEQANLDHLPKVRGYDFNEAFDWERFVEKLGTTGFQATSLSRAIEIVKIMRREKAFLFLGFTSNMISSGCREQIRYLAEHKMVNFLVTAAGGIEEDAIKTMKPFVVGDFEVPGEYLFDNGINRTGNLFVPNECFTHFDRFMRTFLEDIYERYTKQGKIVNTTALARELGLALNNDESYLTWAARNNIPVVCPAIMDGSFGDMVYFFRQRHPDFTIDTSSDMDRIVKACLNNEKTGAILLGAGMSKHYILNANIFKEGLDYAVYINTSQEFDGSDSGARIDEAISWGKVKPRQPSIKVFCDATIAFPLLVAATFAKERAESKGEKST